MEIQYQNLRGSQELYSLAVFEETLRLALNNGLMDVTLDNKWDVPAFQLYMGDLSDSIPQARNYVPDDPFTV